MPGGQVLRESGLSNCPSIKSTCPVDNRTALFLRRGKYEFVVFGVDVFVMR